jgi:hypothetical protein
MNALAADQEKRFARVIWRTSELKQAGIRVGNYTGRYAPSDPGASADSGTRAMGENFGITNHQAQQDDPPDILLNIFEKSESDNSGPLTWNNLTNCSRGKSWASMTIPKPTIG